MCFALGRIWWLRQLLLSSSNKLSQTKVKQPRLKAPQGASSQVGSNKVNSMIEDRTIYLTLPSNLTPKVTRRKTNSSSMVQLTINKDQVLVINGLKQ